MKEFSFQQAVIISANPVLALYPTSIMLSYVPLTASQASGPALFSKALAPRSRGVYIWADRPVIADSIHYMFAFLFWRQYFHKSTIPM